MPAMHFVGYFDIAISLHIRLLWCPSNLFYFAVGPGRSCIILRQNDAKHYSMYTLRSDIA